MKFRRPSARMTAIGVVVAAAVLAGVVALGRYITLEPLPPAKVTSAVDACNQFWNLVQSDTRGKQLRAETRALAAGLEPFDSELADRLKSIVHFARPGYGIRERAEAIYHRCLNEHYWSPPTEEIAKLREGPPSAN